MIWISRQAWKCRLSSYQMDKLLLAIRKRGSWTRIGPSLANGFGGVLGQRSIMEEDYWCYISHYSSQYQAKNIFFRICSWTLEVQHKATELDSRFICRIGNGASTSFWFDKWLPDDFLAAHFPQIFTISLGKKALIGSREGRIRFNLRLRCIVKDEEIEEWDELFHRLSSIHLSPSPDAWLWKFDNKGTFNTNSLSMKEPPTPHLYESIYWNFYQRKVKSFYRNSAKRP